MFYYRLNKEWYDHPWLAIVAQNVGKSQHRSDHSLDEGWQAERDTITMRVTQG